MNVKNATHTWCEKNNPKLDHYEKHILRDWTSCSNIVTQGVEKCRASSKVLRYCPFLRASQIDFLTFSEIETDTILRQLAPSKCKAEFWLSRVFNVGTRYKSVNFVAKCALQKQYLVHNLLDACSVRKRVTFDFLREALKYDFLLFRLSDIFVEGTTARKLVIVTVNRNA